MIDPAILRRRVNKSLFTQIKKDQLKMNRFEVAVKHELSLVSVRFAFQAHNYQQFRDLCVKGIVGLEGRSPQKRIRAAAIEDLYTPEESPGFNTINVEE